MTTIKGLHVVRKRASGKPVRWYVYAWRGGPCIMQTTGGGRPRLTDEAVAAYHAAVVEARRAPPQTFGRLIQDWRASPEWSDLAPSTRREWARFLDMIPEGWQAAPLQLFEDRRMRAKIIAWRNRLAGADEAGKPKNRRKADYAVTVLRALLAWARNAGRLSINVADGIPTLWRGGKHAATIWTAEDRDKMRAAAQPIQDALTTLIGRTLCGRR